ncbi:MAG: DUF6090 family protein [Bacteroidota bacterium]
MNTPQPHPTENSPPENATPVNATRPWTILGRLSQAVREQNWFAVALELGIVVLGVFIGLQVNNWNASRVDRAEERALLLQIQESLAADRAELIQGRDRLDDALSDLTELRDHLQAGRPYDPGLDQKFGRMYGAVGIGLKTGPYEQLKEGRLSLIRNRALRAQIIEVYDNQFANVEFYTRQIQPKIVLENYWPFFMANFVDIVQWERATPRDYDALLVDTYFMNLLDYRITHIERGQREAYLTALDAVDQLTAALAVELST